MLLSLVDLFDVAVAATDGEIGKVCNFLFDDLSWTIRYVVVDVRSWLTRHDVVLSVEAMDQLDWTKKTLRVNLSKDQVRHSPDVDSRKPVSRQQEFAMRQYFGLAADRARNINAEFPSISLPAGREFPVDPAEDPHLRSTENLTGYEVWATDGEIGHLENFIVDEGSWHIGYLDVKTGHWLHSRSILIPTRWVKSVSWAHHRVKLDHTRF